MILFNDLESKYKLYASEIDAVIKRVLASGWYILGEEGRNFEASFSEYIGVKHVVGVNSGTDALFLGLKALGVKANDEVITVPNTAVPTISAIRMAGAKPVFVDVLPNSLVMNPALIEKKITSATKVILPVHLYGYPAPMADIMAIAESYNLKVIEDAAQAHGAICEGRMVGTWGDLGCFSFYPTKNLGAFGDGGAVATSNESLAEIIRQLRNYGEVSKYSNKIDGVNSRLDEIQAAILSWALSKLPEWNQSRQQLAELYHQELAGLPIDLPPFAVDNNMAVWHLFVIRTDKRDELQKYLRDNNVQTSIHYPKPVFEQEAYSYLGEVCESYPEVERAKKRILSLPMYPEMKSTDVAYVCNLIKKFYETH